MGQTSLIGLRMSALAWQILILYRGSKEPLCTEATHRLGVS